MPLVFIKMFPYFSFAVGHGDWKTLPFFKYFKTVFESVLKKINFTFSSTSSINCFQYELQPRLLTSRVLEQIMFSRSKASVYFFNVIKRFLDLFSFYLQIANK